MGNKTEDDEPGLRPVLDLVPEGLKPPSAQKRRLFELPPPDADESILYQHSVLCQTCLPFRDPGDEIRSWERANGLVNLLVAAGQAFHPDTRKFVEVGLPYGPKPRLVLYHLNAEALRTQSPVIELEDSLTAFVKRTLGLDAGGRTLRTVKDQLTRLSAADFRIGTMVGEGRAVTLKGSVIEGFELWVTRDPQQRVLWPTTVQFSQRYFDSLMKHAVPLNETAVARLSHSAMALDIYTWLAQRLHRIEEGKTALVPWASLWEQFGHGYAQIREFRRVFNRTLKQVKVVYPEAKFDLSPRGMQLRHSWPPVARRLLPMSRE
ncbi:MAG: replication protein RepA [Pseudomonadota bacterium]|nr:replication protein RepA [Pseudomonadota bacterium]